jgi:hypothetical protein
MFTTIAHPRFDFRITVDPVTAAWMTPIKQIIEFITLIIFRSFQPAQSIVELIGRHLLLFLVDILFDLLSVFPSINDILNRGSPSQ